MTRARTVRSISVNGGGGCDATRNTGDSGFAFLFAQPVMITGAGTYKTPFTFGANCGTASGDSFGAQGHGIMVYVAVPSVMPGFFMGQSATFTFSAPEPSPISLLLLGFAGLAVLGRRRGSRVTMLQMG